MVRNKDLGRIAGRRIELLSGLVALAVACASAASVDVQGCGAVDLSAAEGLAFEACVDDWTAVDYVTGVFESRQEDRRGYYMTRLVADDLPQTATTNWVALRLGKRELYNVERDPPGWANVCRASFGFRLKEGRRTGVKVRNVVPVPMAGADVVVAFPEQGLAHNRIGVFNASVVKRAPKFCERIKKEGVDASLVSLHDLEAGRWPMGTKLVFFPYPEVETPEVARVREKLSRAGVAWWAMARGNFDDLGGELARRAPALAEKCARRQAARQAEFRQLEEEIARMPSVTGEVRVLDCHDAWGSSGKGTWRDWETVAAHAAACGITHLMVNFDRGPFAAYASKVLRPWPAHRRARETDALAECQTACAKHGLKLMAWRCCWGLPKWLAPKELVASFRAAGRVQKNYKGEYLDSLCPSHPENIREEIESQVELAARGAWAVHFDYIRFANDESCYCEGCRKAFEAHIGKALANWPQDVMGGPQKAAWRAYRRDCITRVVKGVAERVHRDFPGVKLSASVLSGDPEAVADGCGQDWTRWCREGWLDIALPMDYAKEPEAYRRQLLVQKAAQVGSAKIWPNMGPSCWSAADPAAWLTARQIQITRACGFDGWAIFALDERIEKMLPVLRRGPLKN